MKQSYEQQNDEIFKSFLNTHFFDGFSKGKGHLEVILTSDCNLSCSYCYLQKRADELYPKKFRNSKTILKNLGILLDWLIENKYTIRLDLFSGEIFASKIGFDALELIYQKYKEAPQDSRIKSVLIPSNMSFIADDMLCDKVEDIIKKYDELNIRVIISASVDGKYLETNRPYTTEEENRDNSYYDKLFSFLSRHNYGTHPMVSSKGIENWIDNYDWYVSMLKKHSADRNIDIPMMLEVRDDEWTDESIQKYLKFINHVVEAEFANCGHDINKMARRVFLKPKTGYDNIALVMRGEQDSGITCAIQRMLYVRLGDLAIVPCHRTAYEQFIYGYFVTEEDKITDIKSKNSVLAPTIYSISMNSMPECSTCSIKHFCNKGCLGSQFESTGDLFIPIESVCKLYAARTHFLLNKYATLGVLQQGLTLLPDHKKNECLKLCKEWGLDEKFNL